MDIIIHNLNTSNKIKIKTKKYIKKLAVYKNLVAALLNDKIYVYNLSEEDKRLPTNIIKWDTEVNLILLTKNHLLICLDNRIISYEINSTTFEREWSFDSDIKYLRVLGGAAGREALITGLKNGEIYLIYVDNQFPIMLYQHDIPIRSLDVSCNRKKLAIVDENFDIFVVEISTKNIVWKNEKAKSVAFNSDIEDMICYWYDGNVYIKTADFPPLAEKMNGVIVGFRGTKVYLLQAMNNINILDISHSNSIMKYCEDKNFKESYSVASLGATNQEWMFIGFESLLNFELTVAINSFKKVQDIRLINLVFKVEQDLKEGVNKEVISGDIFSFMGKYKEAADSYIKGGSPEKAMEMYSVLKDWTKAIEIKNTHLQNSDISITDGLLVQQADWLLGNNKIKEAAEIYWILGKKKKVIEIYGEKGMLDNLIEICRGLHKEDSADLISLCGHYFKQHKHYEYASESYLKLGDSKALVLMNLDLGQFDKAFILARNDKKLLEYTYLQYGDYLVKNDKFHEAQEAFKNGGRVDMSIRLLEKLIDNAVYEKRYRDACMLFVSLANDTLMLLKDFNLTGNVSGVATKIKAESHIIKDFYDSSDMIEILVAYDIVYKYIEEPFVSDLVTIDNIGLFNACRFLVNKLANTKSNCKQLKMVYRI
jgi:intraflagellar transport protein 122